jgi:hypothetical protein
VDIPSLCEALADHRLDLLAPDEEVDLESLLSTLDGLLIAMTEESEAEEITPDTFQDLLCRSLVHLQLASPDRRREVNELFAARPLHPTPIPGPGPPPLRFLTLLRLSLCPKLPL